MFRPKTISTKKIQNNINPRNRCTHKHLENKTIARKNNQETIILLKNPNDEVNIPNKIPYSINAVSAYPPEYPALIEKEIIRPSTSPHSAPAFYVENNNEIKRGKRRMVINYKKMNDATIGDSYKLPRKEYILEKIK